MSAQHTPGPWKTMAEECDRSYIRVRGTVLGGRFKVANVLSPTYENVHPREAEETRANASLIAAAPDMLAALRCAATVLLLLKDEVAALGCHSKNVPEMVRASIAAATGQKGE